MKLRETGVIYAARPLFGTNQQQDWRSDGAQAAPGPDAHHPALLGALGHGSGRKAIGRFVAEHGVQCQNALWSERSSGQRGV